MESSRCKPHMEHAGLWVDIPSPSLMVPKWAKTQHVIAMSLLIIGETSNLPVFFGHYYHLYRAIKRGTVFHNRK